MIRFSFNFNNPVKIYQKTWNINHEWGWISYWIIFSKSLIFYEPDPEVFTIIRVVFEKPIIISKTTEIEKPDCSVTKFGNLYNDQNLKKYTFKKYFYPVTKNAVDRFGWWELTSSTKPLTFGNIRHTIAFLMNC